MKDFYFDQYGWREDYTKRMERQGKKLIGFDLLMIKKYRHYRPDDKTRCMIIPALDNIGGAKIPLDIYKKEMKEFFKDEPDLMPKF